MIKRLAVPFVVLVLCHSTLAAQSMASGTWTGSATPPGEEALTLTYDVSVLGDSISILIRTSDRGDYPASEAKLVADNLTFRFHPALMAQCNLARQGDGSFVGECLSEGGMSVTMVMKPPAGPAGSGE
jgi:hypothetical protein